MGSGLRGARTGAADRSRTEYISVHESDSPWRRANDDRLLAPGAKKRVRRLSLRNLQQIFSRRVVQDGKLVKKRDLDGYEDLDEEIVDTRGSSTPDRWGTVVPGGKGGTARRRSSAQRLPGGNATAIGDTDLVILAHCEAPGGKAKGKRCQSLPMRGICGVIRGSLAADYDWRLKLHDDADTRSAWRSFK